MSITEEFKRKIRHEVFTKRKRLSKASLATVHSIDRTSSMNWDRVAVQQYLRMNARRFSQMTGTFFLVSDGLRVNQPAKDTEHVVFGNRWQNHSAVCLPQDAT